VNWRNIFTLRAPVAEAPKETAPARSKARRKKA
jgi:hypothetical protein